MMTMIVLVGAITVAAVTMACGGDDDASAGSQADRAFLEAMVPHHESAISMARVAKRQAEHPQITELAQAISTTQASEIRQLGRIHRRLFGERILPNEDAHEALGLSAEEVGMVHMEPADQLKTARPFDKAFIDEMVPHHLGAIRMASAVRDETEDADIRSLANAIISAQTKEIEAMNKWRTAWYGEPSPASALPPATGPDDESMGEHEGH
jgi:uncharacterized protein (DUF305 family)